MGTSSPAASLSKSGLAGTVHPDQPGHPGSDDEVEAFEDGVPSAQ